MQDQEQTPLRVVGRSRDGQELILSDGEGNKYQLELSDNVRSVINAPVLRVTTGGAVEYANEDDAPLTPKLMQQRIRSGESVEAIARSAGIAVSAVERFAGPVLLERQHMAEQAQQTLIRKDGQTLLAVVVDRLLQRGVAPESIDWDSWKREDGKWFVSANYPSNDGMSQALWLLDNSKRSLTTENDNARWLTGDDRSPAEKVAVPAAGMVPTAQPRLSAVREPQPTLDSSREPSAPESTGRKSIPSWDDILFGTTRQDD